MKNENMLLIKSAIALDLLFNIKKEYEKMKNTYEKKSDKSFTTVDTMMAIRNFQKENFGKGHHL